jgi:hypothetical protein
MAESRINAVDVVVIVAYFLIVIGVGLWVSNTATME